MRTDLILIRAVILGTVSAVVAAASPARAAITEIDQFRNDAYTQTGDGNTLTFSGTFFGFRLNADTANEYDSAQVAYPGPDSPARSPSTRSSRPSTSMGRIFTRIGRRCRRPFRSGRTRSARSRAR